MRKITVLNPKGGCGKTTVATGLASWLASIDYSVGLADLDPQQSSNDWLDMRPEEYPTIEKVGKGKKSPGDIDFLIVDAPAAISGAPLSNLVRSTETILVPMLPSPIDMRAGYRFLEHLFGFKQVADGKTKVGLVANRVNERTLVYKELVGFLGHYKAPFVAHLRESMNYIRAFEQGLGVGDLPYYRAWKDWEEWESMEKWVKSKKSQPKA
ncbi:MAG: AAA family ATPase [Xanthomonadales bacterium]|nr:AAA family ATPase [Xanthomonadales bacterium]